MNHKSKKMNIDRSKSCEEKESCVLCNGSHDLDECKAYTVTVRGGAASF